MLCNLPTLNIYLKPCLIQHNKRYSKQSIFSAQFYLPAVPHIFQYDCIQCHCVPDLCVPTSHLALNIHESKNILSCLCSILFVLLTIPAIRSMIQKAEFGFSGSSAVLPLGGNSQLSKCTLAVIPQVLIFKKISL